MGGKGGATFSCTRCQQPAQNPMSAGPKDCTAGHCLIFFSHALAMLGGRAWNGLQGTAPGVQGAPSQLLSLSIWLFAFLHVLQPNFWQVTHSVQHKRQFPFQGNL